MSSRRLSGRLAVNIDRVLDEVDLRRRLGACGRALVKCFNSIGQTVDREDAAHRRLLDARLV